MHILYIHQYFSTPLGCTGTRSYEFARRWVAKGHKVTMLTSTAQLTSQDMAVAKGVFFKKFTIEGIDVLALAIPYRQQMNILKRCMAFFAFTVISSFTVFFLRKVDIVYASSTPLTIGIPGLMAKWFMRKKLVFEARDHWPWSMVELGVLKNKFLIKILSLLEKIIYKNSAIIITVSDGMAEGIRQFAGADKPICVVPNGADLDLFSPAVDGTAFRRENGWDNKLVLIHAGAMGWANNLEFIVEAAAKLRDCDDILFILIGQGAQKTKIEDKVAKLGLKNVEIRPSVEKKQLSIIYSAVDIVMATFANFAFIEKYASLNKFFDGISAGKPMLLNYSGWQRKLLEDNYAGFGCRICDMDEFIEKILYFHSHRNELVEMGKNARRIAEEKFNRDKLAQQALTELELAIRTKC